MVICPGIANHSEKQYIRTFVDYAQKNGYRCAVLNHLGALPNIELTSPRMFTYGKYLLALIPHTFSVSLVSKLDEVLLQSDMYSGCPESQANKCFLKLMNITYERH